MPYIFPGMNPYLEHRAIWPEVHHRLITAIAEYLSPQLRPKYRVAIEVRIYENNGNESLSVGIPDVTIKKSLITSNIRSKTAILEPETQPLNVNVPLPLMIKQGYLEVREIATKEVVTAIEILSPANKNYGKGRESYCKKRLKIFGSNTNLIEIDLLRNGEPLPIYDNVIDSHYRILISRSDTRPKANLYAFNIQDKIPLFPVPLKPEDNEPLIDLNNLLNSVYDKASFDLELDYTKNPVPPLNENDTNWLNKLINN